MYLRAEKLLPSDVLLSSSKGKFSKAIKVATDGDFSHAAIVISVNKIFEADNGLGYSRLKVKKVEKHNQKLKVDLNNQDIIKHPFRVLCDISEYDNFAVYRHQDIINSHINDLKLAKKLVDLVTPLNGLEYPKLVNLANASDFFDKYPRLKHGILKLVGDLVEGDNKKLAEGLFCSELVTFLLQELGLVPFKEEISANHVAPSHFAKPELSNMILIDDIYADADDSINNDEELYHLYAEAAEWSLTKPDQRTQVELYMAIEEFQKNIIHFISRIENNQKPD